MNSKTIEISWASLWRILFFVLFVAVLYLGRQVFLVLFLAIVISSGLEAVVDFLERRKIPRTLGVILIFLFAISLLAFVVYTLVPRVIVELNAALASFGDITSSGFLSQFSSFSATQSFGAFVQKISSAFFAGNLSPLGLISRTVGGVGLAAVVLVISFYLSLSRDGVERFLRVVLPATYEKRGLLIYERSRKKIGAWFQAQVLLSVIMGVLVWVSLELLGVKHAFLLGIFAGIFELVPFVGPILSGAMAVLVSFSVSVSLAIYTLIVFLVLHQFESNVLVPILTRKIIGLHPVIVIVSMLIGAEIWGLLGILVAVPAAAVFVEVLDEWSIRKRAPAV